MDTPSTSFDRQRPGLFERFRIDNDSDGVSDMDVDSGEEFSETGFASDGSFVSDAAVDSPHSSGENSRPAVRRTPPTRQAPGQPPANSRWIRVTPPEVQRDAASRPAFTARNPGPRQVPARNSDPITYLELFFDNEMMIHITRETNRYADMFLSNEAIVEWIREHPHSRFKKWPAGGITVIQLKKYLGLSINMGLIVKKKLETYWSTKPSQATPYFGSVMPYWQFALIARMLHVSDKSKEKSRDEEGYDPWQKVRPVLDRLNLAFKRHYMPLEHVSVDESMIGMKNRVVYIQYMPNKRHARFGIKKFELCDDKGYVIHVELYAGKDFDIRHDEGQAHAVVMTLMEKAGLLNKGYHLFTDNFYTKPKLAEALYEKDTYLTGTVRANSKGMPPEITKAKLNVGETVYYRKDKILSVAFREKQTQRKPVILLSTYHHAEDVTVEKRGKERTKPALVTSYNKHMGGVDVSDKKVYHVAAERPSHRYWVKIFRNLLDISLLNAYEIYALNTDQEYKLNRYEFLVSIVEAWCSTTVNVAPANPLQTNIAEHRLVLLPGKKERDCIVCSDRKAKQRRRSRHWCPACGVGCHEQCEERFEHRRRPAHQRRKRKADEIDTDSE